MNLTIFDSIIYGALQPWQPANENEQSFSDLLSHTGRTEPVTIGQLNKALKGLLRDFKNLYYPINTNSETGLEQFLYKNCLPESFNNVTEYYLLLMQCSALQFLFEINTSVNAATNEIDAYYIVNTALEKLKYIAAGAATELLRQKLTATPNYKAKNNLTGAQTLKRNTHFILYAVKQHSIRLFFELQTRFEPYIKAFEAEDHFYLHTLKEALPENPTLKPTVLYFDWKANKMFKTNPFSLEPALQLLSEIKAQNEKGIAAEIITGIENFIFANIFDVAIESVEIVFLTNDTTSSKYFEQVKQITTEQVNRLTYGHQRFDLISTALNKISFLHSQDHQKTSALSKLQQWLTLQAEAYKGNLSNSFAVASDEEKIKLKKGKPLPKADKTLVDDFKHQAQEFLKHFSGYNTQQNKIMSEPDYNRLIEYTFHLIEHEKLPKEIKQIPTIALSGNHIRYTYYQMHKAFYGTNEIKTVWIDFLHKVFKQLSTQNWNTLKTKFSAKPGNYDHDINVLNTL